jgi:hypothetical protein
VSGEATAGDLSQGEALLVVQIHIELIEESGVEGVGDLMVEVRLVEHEAIERHALGDRGKELLDTLEHRHSSILSGHGGMVPEGPQRRGE